MALLFMDGFDHYKESAGGVLYGPERKWDYYDRTAGLGVGRFGGYCLQGDFSLSGILHKYLSADESTLIVGLAFKIEDLLDPFVMVRFLENSTQQCQVVVDRLHPAGQQLYFTGPGGNIYGTVLDIADGEWHHLEMKIVFGNSGSVEVRLDGSVEIQQNVDTIATANAWCDEVRLYIFRNYAYADDFYICNNSGSSNNDFLGPTVRIETVFPDGAGAVTQWTPSAGANYTCVDEAEPNDDTDYVADDGYPAVGNIDVYAFGALPTVSGSVKGLQTNILNKRIEASARTIRRVIRSGGVNFLGTSETAETDYMYASEISEIDPDTGSAWSIGGVNAAQFGVELES